VTSAKDSASPNRTASEGAVPKGATPARRLSGQVLQRLRSGRGLVQEELASRLGKARSSLAGWEVGRGGLNLDNLVAFLDELGVTMEEFGRHFDALRREQAARPDGAGARATERAAPAAGALPAVPAEAGSPVVLHAHQAVVMVFGEEQQVREAGRESARQDEALRPWVQDLFKRAERLFPGPEEVAETAQTPPADKKAVGD